MSLITHSSSSNEVPKLRVGSWFSSLPVPITLSCEAMGQKTRTKNLHRRGQTTTKQYQGHLAATPLQSRWGNPD